MTSENNKTKSYVKVDGKDEWKFREWIAVTMAVGAKEGWLEILISNVLLDMHILFKACLAALIVMKEVQESTSQCITR